jgi:chemotaxis methyl-accepting protein methylase
MSTSGAAPAPILTEAELRLLQALVYQECGMHFDERRTHFLQDRLLKRLKECKADSFYAYYRLLISQDGKAELAKLVENLTVNETSFFRHKAQLDLFQKFVLEDMLKQKQAHREYSIRIWSAGCSTGQEAYTLAMMAVDSGLLLPAQSPAGGGGFAQTADSATLARGNTGQRYQLLRVAHRTRRCIQRAPDGHRRLRLPLALLRQDR